MTKVELPKPFSEKEISVTLTGEEWFSLLVMINNGIGALSDSGVEIFDSACAKIREKIKEAS